MIINVERRTPGGVEVESINLDIENDFNIDETQLSKNMTLSGSTIARYASLASDLRAESARKKAELEFYESGLELRIRDEASKKGVKTTEDMIKSLKRTDQKRYDMNITLLESEHNCDKMENLFRALVKKIDLLIALSYKQKAELKGSGW